jgi:hypothetical protein
LLILYFDTVIQRDSQKAAKIQEELYCYCKKEFREEEFMVACDGPCNNWYHGECLGLQPINVAKVKTFVCPECYFGAEINLQPPLNDERDLLAFIATNQPIFMVSGAKSVIS